MEEGTLYPALKRFYENGYLDYYWVEKENNLVKRKYYRITIKGKEYLNYKKSEYKKIKSLIDPLI